MLRALLVVLALAGPLPAAYVTYLQDTFDRADSAGPNPGTATTGQSWTGPTFGSWGIASNLLYKSATNNDSNVFVDCGFADIRASLTVTTISGGQNWGLIFRGTDQSNFLMMYSDATTVQIFQRVAGAFTSLDSEALVVASGDVFLVVASGTSIKGYVNGTERLSVTSSTHQAATRVGMYSGSNQDAHRWNNLLVTGLVDSVTASQPLSPYILQNSNSNKMPINRRP